MKTAATFIALTTGVILAFPALAVDEATEQIFAKGEAKLAEGDFQGALSAYSAALQAEPKNQEYLQHFMLLRRVMTLQQALDEEKDPQRWEYVARALNSFYLSEGIYSQALELNRQVYAKLKTGSSAVMLAETALAMNRNAEAAEALQNLASGETTASTRALLGVALARQGKLAEAGQVAGSITVPESAGPATLYRLARLHAMTGDAARALDALGHCFESLPPSRLAAFKNHATRCPDFTGLASTAGFTTVLRTESKVPESKCSGGSKCAGCPMRSKCAKSQGTSQSQ